MQNTLWIAEKPELGRAIANALGSVKSEDGYIVCQNNNIVTWAYGHLIESKPPEAYCERYATWDIKDLPLVLFPIKYQAKQGCGKQLKNIYNLMQKSNCVVNAGDMDEEGQLLIDEILRFLNWKGTEKRVHISDMTLPSVKKSIANIQDNRKYRPIYLRAYARTAADQIYGKSMSRFFSKKSEEAGNKQTISIGRVQTPTLGLIVDRYLQNQSHKESFFYGLLADLSNNHGTATGMLIMTNSMGLTFDDKGRAIDKTQIEAIKSNLLNHSLHINKINRNIKKEAPPLPYNLARLQQDMNKRYKLTADQTLKITQVLREKYACITYNRSDSSYLSSEQFNEAPELLKKLQGFDQYNGFNVDHTIQSKAFDDTKVTAHTAIIPTLQTPNLTALNENERNVYLAICDLYVAQFLPLKESNVIEILASISGHDFKYSASKNTIIGHAALLKPIKDEDDAEDDAEDDTPSDSLVAFNVLNALKEGEKYDNITLNISQKKTSAPALFTEATLISAMTRIADFVKDPKIKEILKKKDAGKKDEHGSIGTSATRSTIIEGLKKRNFIAIKKNKVIPSEAAISLIQCLPPMIRNPDLTALWFSQQESIEEGSLKVEDFIKGLYNEIYHFMKSSDQIDFSIIKNKSDNLTCPICHGSNMSIKPKLAACADCDFKIWRTMARKELTDNMLKEIITKGSSKVIKGFKSKADKNFDAKVVLDVEAKTVKFSFS